MERKREKEIVKEGICLPYTKWSVNQNFNCHHLTGYHMLFSSTSLSLSLYFLSLPIFLSLSLSLSSCCQFYAHGMNFMPFIHIPILQFFTVVISVIHPYWNIFYDHLEQLTSVNLISEGWWRKKERERMREREKKIGKEIKMSKRRF